MRECEKCNKPSLETLRKFDGINVCSRCWEINTMQAYISENGVNRIPKGIAEASDKIVLMFGRNVPRPWNRTR